MQNVLIVLSGKAQSGKSTSAKVLEDVAGRYVENNEIVHKRVKIYSFATALKTIAKEYFGWDGDKGIYFEETTNSGAVDIHGGGQVDAVGRLPIPDKGRQLLINIGQHFRQIRPTIWVDYVVNKIKAEGATGQDKVFVIDDLRFRNELELVKNGCGIPCISVRLKRESQLNLNDISETDLDNSKFDYYIENNGDIEDLTAKMSGLFEEIKLKYQ